MFVKKHFSQFLFIIFLIAFTSSIIRVSVFAFYENTEDIAEELVDLSEEETEKEYIYEFRINFINSLISDLPFSKNNAQINFLLASNYTEPHPKNLFSPPEFKI